ncbi:MAG TPA: hypothetical protein VGB36_01520 [Gammaproteobacteria bacterium]
MLLLKPVTSYRASDFLEAARRLGVEIVVAYNHHQVLDEFSRGRTVTLDFESIEKGVSRIAVHARRDPISAVFGTDEETTVLAAAASKALGLPISELEREHRAAGVMMIPIPGAGRLSAVTGLDAARTVPGIDQVIIGVPIGERLVPLPEGDRYLGFIFARAHDPGEVESALRNAHQRLGFEIAPLRP